MVKVYYNEIDPYCAQWLKNLIDAKWILPGEVDQRDIKDVKADDIRGYQQLHFFAGIGGWPLALQMADWPNDRSVWTGSCPCQLFSVAGKRKGQADKRHLWPVWFRLIAELRPATIFGEQVASAITAGWWDDAANDMESKHYAVAAAVLPACSVGAPHRRDRLFFVGHAKYYGLSPPTISRSLVASSQYNPERTLETIQPSGTGGRTNNAALANAENAQSRRLQQPRLQSDVRTGNKALPHSNGHGIEKGSQLNLWERQRPSNQQSAQRGTYPHWQTDAGICRLADGVPARVGKLRALGNAIVPQVAAEFINTFGEITS